jgi:hypothetical protein
MSGEAADRLDRAGVAGEPDWARRRSDETLIRSSDADEVNQYKTYPLQADTDRGGDSDGVEFDKGTDPLDSSDDTPDTDRDGLTDPEEKVLGSNPKVADTDRDGLGDKAEVTGSANTRYRRPRRRAPTAPRSGTGPTRPSAARNPLRRNG